MLALTKNFDKALNIYSDVIQNAEFPDAEVETYRKRQLGALLQRRDNADAVANLVCNKICNGDPHPYGVSLSEKSPIAIKRDDLKNYHTAFYHPNNAVKIWRFWLSAIEKRLSRD
jgi:zinc protease